MSDDTREALRAAGEEVRERIEQRNRLIREAVAKGGTLRDVGAAVGLSHTAVRFITNGRGDKT